MSSMFQTVRMFDLYDLFKDTAQKSGLSLVDGTRLKYYKLNLVDTVVALSNIIPVRPGNNEIAIYAEMVNNSGILSATIDLGLFRGEGLLATDNGFEFQNGIISFGSTDSGVFKKYSVSNLVLASDYPFPELRLRINQTGTQNNDLVLYIAQYTAR